VEDGKVRLEQKRMQEVLTLEDSTDETTCAVTNLEYATLFGVSAASDSSLSFFWLDLADL